MTTKQFGLGKGPGINNPLWGLPTRKKKKTEWSPAASASNTDLPINELALKAIILHNRGTDA